MQFFNPEAFLFLWSIPIVFLIFVHSRRTWKARIQKFGNSRTIQNKLMPTYRTGEHRVQLFYIIIVLALSILALARPQWGEEKKKVERKGIDIIFMLDTSLSMLAEDAKPNRLTKAKREIKSIVDQLSGDRVGMVAFAGSGFLQSPITLDYSAFFLFLDAIDTGYIPDPGTSIDRAVQLATTSFPKDNTKHKAIILFSDGEDHQGGIERAVKAAQEANVRVYTFGVGRDQGEPIPLKDEKGRRSGFKKDRSGEIVMTKLNQPLLEELAKQTGGLYLPSTPAETEIELLMRHMSSLDEQSYKEKLITEKEDHFQIFLLFAFVFLVLEMLVKRSKKIRTESLSTLPLALIFLLFSGFIETTHGLNENANELFSEKKYQSATELYQKAKIKTPDDPAIGYNLGTSLYQMKEYQAAGREFDKVIKKLPNEDPLKSQALYNYGNTQYRLGDFEGAIESYKKAIDLNPEDQDAKYNLEFLQKQQSMFNDQNQDKEDPKQDQQGESESPEQQQNNQQNQSQGSDKNQDQNKDNQDQKDQQDQQNQNQQNENQQDQESQDQEQNQQDNQQDQSDQGSDEESKDQQDQQSEDKDREKDEKEREKDEKDREKSNDPGLDLPLPAPESDQESDKEKNDQESDKEKDDEQQPDESDSQADNKQDAREEPDNQQNQNNNQPNQQPEQNQGGQGGTGRPLQGQMSMDNALRILDALKGDEKELQDLRRPKPPRQPPLVAKDW